VKTLENGQQVAGGGIATASLLYLALPVAMGLLARFTGVSLAAWSIVFLPLVGLSIWFGQQAPLSLEAWLGVEPYIAQRWWNVILLGYCFVASVIPMWLLLQPRGMLGGYFLFAVLIGGGLGLIFSGAKIEYPAFIGWESARGQPLFPMLFIMIACGACSGFHSMVASGTTSKQLRCETDARLIGYGAMLMESMVAVVSLCCVMMLAPGSPLLSQEPNLLYANGIGRFLSLLGVPFEFAVAFALMAFATFVYDTLDVCTRLGRYVVQELTGWHGAFGRFFATAVTIGAPLYFLTLPPEMKAGAPVPIWLTFWGLFGASNQLLAALTLIGVTVWLWRTRGAAWVWFVTGVPAAFMYALSMWELARTMWVGFAKPSAVVELGGVMLPSSPVPWVAAVLAGLALLVLVEALVHGLRPARPMTPQVSAA
jgi:carbon starvation protein